ncbi:hypothetical protein [Streptomyces montanus]|nr:hypothetical protein [Streptomyces montanus]
MIGAEAKRDAAHMFEQGAIVPVQLCVIFQQLSKRAPFARPGRD